MSQTERLYRIKGLLDAGGVLRRGDLLRELEVSAATLKRDIEYLRDRLGTPIAYDRTARGWRLDDIRIRLNGLRELPGLWMNEREIRALMIIEQVLKDLDAGDLLAPQLTPLLDRLRGLLSAGSEAPDELRRRIRLVPMAARSVSPTCFQVLGTALLRRRRVNVRHLSRTRAADTERELSPQRLIHYRDNWYLDAWCHWRDALRTFGLDTLQSIEVLDRAAVEIDERELDEVLGAGYGIFGGREIEWATLRFSPERARWVAQERWHPAQQGRLEPDGSWTLQLPFSDPRELTMDVLRHIPQVTVLGPSSLSDMVKSRVLAAARMLD